MNPFGKTGVVIGAAFFALWIIGPWFLIVVFHLLNTSGGNIDLLTGFLKMVSVVGVVFAASYAAAVLFGKPWLIAAPVLFVMVSSLVSHFRPAPALRHTVLVPNAPDPATVLANQAGVSLESLLHFATPTMSPAAGEAVAKVAQARQHDLAGHILKDRGLRNQAFRAATLLTNPSPEVMAAVQAGGREVTEDLRRFNERNLASDCTHLGHVYRDRFLAWSAAWLALHRHAGGDADGQLREILKLAAVRSRDCVAMDEVRLAAQAALERLSGSSPQ